MFASKVKNKRKRGWGIRSKLISRFKKRGKTNFQPSKNIILCPRQCDQIGRFFNNLGDAFVIFCVGGVDN